MNCLTIFLYSLTMASENCVPDTRVVPWRIAGSIPMPSTDRRRRGKIFWKLGGREGQSEREMEGEGQKRHLSKTFQLSDQLSWHLLALSNGGFWFRLSYFQQRFREKHGQRCLRVASGPPGPITQLSPCLTRNRCSIILR